MITIDQAKSLTYGKAIAHMYLKNADNSPKRATVVGYIELSQDSFKLPMKYREFNNKGKCFYLTEVTAVDFRLLNPRKKL